MTRFEMHRNAMYARDAFVMRRAKVDPEPIDEQQIIDIVRERNGFWYDATDVSSMTIDNITLQPATYGSAVTFVKNKTMEIGSNYLDTYAMEIVSGYEDLVTYDEITGFYTIEGGGNSAIKLTFDLTKLTTPIRDVLIDFELSPTSSTTFNMSAPTSGIIQGSNMNIPIIAFQSHNYRLQIIKNIGNHSNGLNFRSYSTTQPATFKIHGIYPISNGCAGQTTAAQKPIYSNNELIFDAVDDVLNVSKISFSSQFTEIIASKENGVTVNVKTFSSTAYQPRQTFSHHIAVDGILPQEQLDMIVSYLEQQMGAL